MPADEARVSVSLVPSPPTPVDRLTAWFRSLNPQLLDAVLGTVFTVAGLVSLFSGGDPKVDYTDPDVLGVVLALGCSLPFYFRRRAPLATTLVATVSLVLLSTLEYPANVQSQMLLVGAYTIGSHTEGRDRVIGVSGIALGVIIVAVVGLPDATTANVALAGAFYAAMFFFGSAMRNRRLYMEQVEERAELLEREHEEAAKRALADERLRIAQELHDVVAHSMGVIAVQAGVGAHVIDTDPAEAKKSLQAISTTSRTTLTEIRRLLGVLRADGDAGYEPAPGLADLDRLVTDLDGAGLPVEVHIQGARHDLPPGVDLTAYRIVQEALTNIARHSGASRGSVEITRHDDHLQVVVEDDGCGGAATVKTEGVGRGLGLIAMRERAQSLDGRFVIGDRPNGGTRLAVTLPLPSATRAAWQVVEKPVNSQLPTTVA